MTPMSHKNKLKVIEHAREELSRFFKRYEFSPYEIQEFCRDKNPYHWKDFDYDGAPKVFKLMAESVGRDSISPTVQYGVSFLRLIRKHRENARFVEDRSAIQKAAEDNVVWATSELNAAFPSKGWEVKCSKFTKPHVEKQTGRYGDNFDVDISIGWGNTVYSENIATVKAGDGERFIMSADKKDLARLAKDGIVAYECQVIKVYRGEATMEDAWVFKYETPTDMIVATHKEFSRAESLLNRRIKDTVVGELIDF
tara:strand:- start:46 stop:807 length:762 start_codon:yes stop_codon:yes gene_type:complete